MNEELKINLNVPAQVLSLPNSYFNLHYHNDLITHVKLRVFYQGTTRDKRLFTEEFSNKLLETLPQTPVVGFYDEETEDFLGHNQTQFIYGYVPENAQFGFEEDEDGQKWAVTEIILFTGRKDNIGKVAQKIIGKQHSLELDPSSMKYKVNRDAAGNMQNIEFTDGKFIGLSVLGDSQSPAFEGSAFFAAENKAEVVETVRELKDIVRQFMTNAEVNNGGEQVEEITQNQSPNILEELQKFMKTTVDEMAEAVTEALRKKFGESIFIVQWSNQEDIVVFFDYEKGAYKRAKYAMKDQDTYEFEDAVDVKPRFLTEEEISQVWGQGGTFNLHNPEQTNVTELATTVPEGIVDGVTLNANIVNAEETLATTTNNPVLNETVATIAGVNNEKLEDERVFITTSERDQIEADRKELNEYRKERKLKVIEKYNEYLSEVEQGSFIADIDNFTIETLEQKLATVAMQKVLAEKQKEKNNFNAVPAFGIRTAPRAEINPNNEDTLTSLVGRYKGK